MFKNKIKITKTIIAILLLTYWILVFIATSMPNSTFFNIGKYDKLAHFSAYGVLAFLMYWLFDLNKKTKTLNWRKVFIIIFILTLYAIFDEIHQSFIPGRSTEFYDFVADIIGIWAGVLVARYIFFNKKQINEEHL